jgi:hypothetical protein
VTAAEHLEVRRVEPKDIDPTVKEAVVDGLLNLIAARVSGGGRFGAQLFGTKPSQQLCSGFLLPGSSATESDEASSPIRIRTHGLDLQVAAETRGRVRVIPAFAVYVRVLPTQDDLARRDCRIQFRLKSTVSRDIRRRQKELTDAWWEANRGTRRYRSEHPDWKAQQAAFRARAMQEVGLPPGLNLSEISRPADEVESDEIGPPVDEGVPATSGVAALPDDLFQPLDIPEKWLRLEITPPPLEFDPSEAPERISERVQAATAELNAAVRLTLEQWAADSDPGTGGQFWGYHPESAEVLPSQFRSWHTHLQRIRDARRPPTLPLIELAWDVGVSSDWLSPERTNLHIALENRSLPPKRQWWATEQAIFQVSVTVTLPTPLHAPLRLGRIDPSYRYNRYLQYDALGFNSAVARVTATVEETTLRTTWMPRYTQPRVRAVTGGVNLSIAQLARPDGLDGITALPDRFDSWISSIRDEVDPCAGLPAQDVADQARERNKFEEDLLAWSGESQSIRTGIEILSASRAAWRERGPQSEPLAMAYEAWLAMNETMAAVAREKQYDEWRLFQLAFILANLASFVTRDSAYHRWYNEQRDDTVTLLYFATGGGKSEAFLGLLTFLLFFDRLRGKSRGISALLRYPLRLLTIQQAQRTAKVLAKAERVRREHHYAGAPFEIGFWVGRSGSPNSLRDRSLKDIPRLDQVSVEDEVQHRRDNRRYAAAFKAWSKLPYCPFCSSPTALRRMSEQQGPVAHICTDVSCFANAGGYAPLPFYICDEDIYAIAPSVLLGTVDKLALIGHSPRTIRRILGMLGAAPWVHERTGRLVVPRSRDLQAGPAAAECLTIAPAYASGVPLFHDPFPALIVQDEAHLLDESLGTFAGIFESTLDAMLDELAAPLHSVIAFEPSKARRRRAKVVAASATVARPERQLQHLYQRKVPAIQFPHPGPDLYRSFYAAPVEPREPERRALPSEWVETRSEHARIYAALLTNGRPHTTTTVAILANFHLAISELFLALQSGAPHRLAYVRRLLSEHLSPGALGHVQRRALENAGAAELLTLIDLHRIALTYVTNKKGGDQILAAEGDETRKLHEAYDIEFDDLQSRLISGAVEQGEIQDAVRAAQDRPTVNEPFPRLGSVLRSVVATSAVSHGVDVDELNAMFFAGLPSDVAEYIQASSRVGRTHVGFCLLVPTPQRRRDRYVVEVFDSFHRFLERMVQPAAIDRWAGRAIERACPSLFQAYLCGVLPTRELLQLPDGEKDRVRDNAFIEEIRERDGENPGQLRRDIVSFGTSAIGLKSDFAPSGERYYRELLSHNFGDLLNSVLDSRYRGTSLWRYFNDQQSSLRRPMTSLRDVDQAGLIRGGGSRVSPLSGEVLADVMSFIRHGNAALVDDLDVDGEEPE